jgi:hypothetical protein
MDRKRHVCASVSCATAEKYDADRLCAGCRSVFYCSPECQRADWKGHKPARKVATAEREASQIVRVGKGGGSAPSAAAPARVGPPASQYVAGAARGGAEALFNLGGCYCRGEGVPQSYEQAAELFQQAASKGHAGGQTGLGGLYRDGLGVSQSYERAAELWKQAAAQGHAIAQAGLGELYYNGQGVPQSYERAAELMKQAAAKGYAGAQVCLGELYRDGLGVPKDVARGVRTVQAGRGRGRQGCGQGCGRLPVDAGRGHAAGGACLRTYSEAAALAKAINASLSRALLQTRVQPEPCLLSFALSTHRVPRAWQVRMWAPRYMLASLRA